MFHMGNCRKQCTKVVTISYTWITMRIKYMSGTEWKEQIELSAEQKGVCTVGNKITFQYVQL